MADFESKVMPDEKSRGVSSPVGPAGTVMNSRRLLGLAGATAVGVGTWTRTSGLWKTFFLYPQDRKTAAHVVGASVEIQGCMELPDAVADYDLAHKTVLATLTPAAPSYSVESPWRYVRAEVKVVGAGAIQVGFYAQGQG